MNKGDPAGVEPELSVDPYDALGDQFQLLDESDGDMRPTGQPVAVRLFAWLVLATLAGAVVLGIGSLVFSGEDPRGDPGRSTEVTYALTASTPLPALADVTVQWGLSAWRHTSAAEASGGIGVGDLDRDGRPDLVVSGGTVEVFFGGASGFESWSGLDTIVANATSTVVADIDLDGYLDIGIGTSTDSDLIVWGGSWAGSRNAAGITVTRLGGSELTASLLVADLNEDGLPDVVRLARGEGSTAPDTIFEQLPDSREFIAQPLPRGTRESLAGEIFDADRDGLNDIWVTRDFGWIEGADSLYSRKPGADDRWVDIAEEMGTALEIDGMGLTIADLNGDHELDGYVSDLGDNEILVANDSGGFGPRFDTGAARISPPDAGESVISSSWASGAVDLNLDGQLDLVVANGGFPDVEKVRNKVPDTRVAESDPPAILMGLGGGRFVDVWPELGLAWTGASRGLALADLDLDGDTDIVLVNHNGGLRVFRNDTVGATVVIRPTRFDCDLTGSVVHADAQSTHFFTLLAPHSFLGNHQRGAIVGAAGAPIEVVVTTPSGEILLTETVTADDDRTEIEVPCPPTP